MREKTCCFCEHRIVVDEIEEKVRAAVIDLIENHGINNFYSGHMGEFDRLCERIVRGLSRRYTLRLSIVLPYMTSAVNKGELERLFDEIIIPDLGNVHYKRAITLRNQWMIEHSDAVLCYVNNDFGGAHRTKQYAAKINVEIIDIL